MTNREEFLSDKDKDREYKCIFCDRPFGDEESLREHQKIHEEEQQERGAGYRVPGPNPEDQNIWREAEQERRRAVDEQARQQNENAGNGNNTGATVASPTFGSEIAQGMRASEGGPSAGPFRCPVCGRIFDNERDLLNHEKTHMGEEVGRTTASDSAPATTKGQLSDRGNQTVPWGEEHRGWTTGVGDREEGEPTGLETPGGRTQDLDEG